MRRLLRRSQAIERRLVWILGSPRTGSTWLLSLLDAHPRVVPVDEPGIGVHLGLFAPDLFGAPASTFSRDQLLIDRLRADQPAYFFARAYEPVWREPLRRLLLARFEAHAAGAGVRPARSTVCAIKEPNGSQAAQLIMSACPRSRLLFMLRDPRDVLDSQLDAARKGTWRARYGGGQELDELGRAALLEERAYRWLVRTQEVQAAFARHEPGLRLLLRYEDLRADTETHLAHVFSWLGLDPPPGGIGAAAAARAFEAVPESERGSGKFHRAATPGLWRENLSRSEQALVDSIVGEKLAELGYER